MLDTSDTVAFSPRAGTGNLPSGPSRASDTARRRCDMAGGIQGADLAQLVAPGPAARRPVPERTAVHPERHEPEGPGEQRVLGGAERRPVRLTSPSSSASANSSSTRSSRRPRRPAASTCRPSSRHRLGLTSHARPPARACRRGMPAGHDAPMSGRRRSSRRTARPEEGAGTLDERVLIAPDEVLESERSSVITGMVIARAWRDPGYRTGCCPAREKSWSTRASRSRTAWPSGSSRTAPRSGTST